MPLDALIRELLAIPGMNEDTLADIRRMQAEHEAGTLDPDDAAYLAALHARLTGAPQPEPVEPVTEARLDGLSLAEWRDRALRAEAELAATRDQLAGLADRP